MWRFMNRANAVTLTGLSAAVASALLAVNGRAAVALVALMVSGLCDLFDGFVARRLALSDEARRFGGHIDSVVDACSFGFAPALLLHTFGLTSLPELVLLVAFVVCAIWRLAYFDTVGLSGDVGAARHYTGLPTTFVALILPVACLFGFAGPSALRIAANVAAVGLAGAMVSPFKIRKPGGAWYGVFLVVAVVLVSIYAIFADRFGR